MSSSVICFICPIVFVCVCVFFFQDEKSIIIYPLICPGFNVSLSQCFFFLVSLGRLADAGFGERRSTTFFKISNLRFEMHVIIV